MDPRILILDDATASVDATTEAKIKLALREVMKGRTTLIIAHRLSTISLAERVVVLEGGRLVARGTHAELIEKSAVYRQIYSHGLVDRTFVDLDGDAPVPRAGPQRQPEAAAVTAAAQGRRGKGRVRTIGRFARPYRGRAIVALFTLLVATATSVAGPVVAKQAIDAGIAPGTTTSSSLWVCVFLAVAVVGWMATAAQSYLTSWVGERVLADLRVDVFAHVQRLDLGFFERTPAGVVISRLTNDIEAMNSWSPTGRRRSSRTRSP